MMSELHPMLRENVRLLGSLLGETIRQHKGDAFFEKIEEIRRVAKEDRQRTPDAPDTLPQLLGSLKDDELLPVTRAFSQFLNLANLAEQYHGVRRTGDPEVEFGLEGLPALFQRLKESGVSREKMAELMAKLKIEFVLTAHPTEVTRRTLIMKYDQMAHCLRGLDHSDLTDAEKQMLTTRLTQLIAQAWHTDEIRKEKPTPQDEAKWGFAVIEHSLWHALPEFLRSLEQSLEQAFRLNLPLDARPILISSWMGGDRDGNPNVTAEVTRQVFLLSRWMAADLFIRDLDVLRAELSMNEASPALLSMTDNANEPYRAILSRLKRRLEVTRNWCAASMSNTTEKPADGLFDSQEFFSALTTCYDSLCACGMRVIAEGRLKDTIRRLSCFGLELVRLDIRQESSRHTRFFDELTRYLDLGAYSEWTEQERQAFLLKELESKRPLVPQGLPFSPESQEVLDTCRIVARQPEAALGTYVISMAGQPSDVLAVKLLLKEVGVAHPMRVAPLFETLEDLKNAAPAIDRLLSLPGYRNRINEEQEVMIGYSDSAKDAGQMMAAWAQYQAQEQLVSVAKKQGIRLTLFHGRGGTVGRGGGPANKAILSQPPGSVNGTFRITEQGEMIRFKFGSPEIAVQSMTLYTSAVVEATLVPPTKPRERWREVMNELTSISLKAYRETVRENPDFVRYFRLATPEQELGKLALGSRPAKRNPSGGVESLRAIPWIFAWTQIRLMLPAWLGAGEALDGVSKNHKDTLQEMVREWPFFRTHIEMLEMVLSKADPYISKYYEKKLVPEELQVLGDALRRRLQRTIDMVNEIKDQPELLATLPVFRHSMQVRNPYTDPLHFIQAELLYRDRHDPVNRPEVEQALKVTMAGIAAGMRNTG